MRNLIVLFLISLLFFCSSNAQTEFNLNIVQQRSADAEVCSAPGEYPPTVKLPINYPANLTLSPDDKCSSSSNNVEEEEQQEQEQTTSNNIDSQSMNTLDNLHSNGQLLYASYMKPNVIPGANIGGSRSMGAKFRNFSGKRLNKMWDDGSEKGVYNGDIGGEIGARGQTNTYVGHAFKFFDQQTGELVERFVMKEDQHLYIIEPDDNDTTDIRNSKEYIEAKKEEQFMKDYYNTNKTPWLSKYGRPAPILNMWPADYIGQVHTVKSYQPYWYCTELDKMNCKQGLDPVSINMTVVSNKETLGPRVLVIENLMSESEADHIVELGKSVVRDSMVGTNGGFKSDTRTSSTGWLKRQKTNILQTVYMRFADVLGLDEKILYSGVSAEELQIVNYKKTQQYQPHHDFGDDGTDEQRFLTLLLYIKIPNDGGATSFPKAFGGKGLRVKPPKKGDAVLFYSMLPDGNGDDLSLHAGEPVLSDDEKWVCNLWVWDPKRSK